MNDVQSAIHRAMTLDGFLPQKHCFAIGRVLFAWSATDPGFRRIRLHDRDVHDMIFSLLQNENRVLVTADAGEIIQLASANQWDGMEHLAEAINDLEALTKPTVEP